MNIHTVSFPIEGHPVEHTAAHAFCDLLSLPAPTGAAHAGSGLRIGLSEGVWPLRPAVSIPDTAWMWARITAEGEGELTASEPALLYALVHLLADMPSDERGARLQEGMLFEPTFSWHRPLFDHVLTQVSRNTRHLDEEAYVADLARCGFTHLEVNGLASHVPFEEGVSTEYYNQFYSYCPALSQFVDSEITQGLYPQEYLQSNLKRLKHLAALGKKYGLKPGLLCFEPRSLPERFFQKYPTLRGARIDHPFRSHLPRYTMAQDHPATREHFRQLMQNLMDEVPELSYMSVWTNDSGAGFEHTGSLYVGRNGGPYLIREWRSHEQIAEAAGTSALRWLRLLRETAAEVNPDFEVCLRIEPFKTEHDVIMAGMGDGVTVEAPSLLVRGYELPYSHPSYPEQESVAGSIFHTEMDNQERDLLATHREQGFEPKMTYAPSSAFNMEPLLGIPFPRMLHRKLSALRAVGVRHANAFGGLLNSPQTPYWPNPEIIRAVQFMPEETVDKVLTRIAARWAGEEAAASLVGLWDTVEEAVAHLPLVPLYSHFGFVWLRTWVRPLVPDMEAIPEPDRRYYERFLVSTANNPAINDLGRDVLFELISQESGERMAGQIDAHVLPRLDEARATVESLLETTDDPARAVFVDLRDRIRALRCWAVTQRNTCAWVGDVYAYLDTDDEAERQHRRDNLRDMTDRDLDNTRELLDLWENSDAEFILVSDVGETSFIYGDNLGDLLRRKIELTEQYADYEPRIDREIIWRLL